MAKARRDFPLAAIPGRKKGNNGKNYPPEFQVKAVELMKTSPAAEVAKKLGVTASILYTWRKALDPLHELREQVDAEKRTRLTRLEHAAYILELEGHQGANIAAAIRTLARGEQVRARFEKAKPRPK